MTKKAKRVDVNTATLERFMDAFKKTYWKNISFETESKTDADGAVTWMLEQCAEMMRNHNFDKNQIISFFTKLPTEICKRCQDDDHDLCENVFHDGMHDVCDCNHEGAKE